MLRKIRVDCRREAKNPRRLQFVYSEAIAHVLNGQTINSAVSELERKICCNNFTLSFLLRATRSINNRDLHNPRWRVALSPHKEKKLESICMYFSLRRVTIVKAEIEGLVSEAHGNKI